MSNLSMLNFNADEVPVDDGFAPLPSGKYEVVIINAEVKRNSKNTGENLRLEFQVINGQFQNRKLFESLSVINPSEDAQRIARAKLSSLCKSMGISTLTDTSQILGKTTTAVVRVVQKKDDQKKPIEGQYQNSIDKYEPRNGAAPATQQRQPATAGAAIGW